MKDKQVSVSFSVPCISAWGAWGLMTALLVAGLVFEDIALGIIGLAFSAIAATLQIRCFLIRLNRNIRAAFELGREASAYGAVPIRPLRPAKE